MRGGLPFVFADLGKQHGAAVAGGLDADDVFAKIYTSLKAISGLYRQNRILIAISDIKIETPFILKILRILDINERDNFTTDPRFD